MSSLTADSDSLALVQPVASVLCVAGGVVGDVVGGVVADEADALRGGAAWEGHQAK